jgi:type IV secretory pathway TrbD component
LGAAYGIIEEGILVRSFFNPNWKDLGILSSYGRWIGVNWVWAEWLVIYHAIFSIAIPIFLVEQTWPQAKKQIWLSSRSRVMFHGLLIASIIAGFFAFPYDAPIFGLVGCVVAVATLGWLAKHLPNINKIDEHVRMRWRWLIPLGFSAPAVFFFMFNSGLIPYAIITMILGIVLVFGYARLLTSWSGKGLTEYQKLGVVTGALVFFALFFDFIIEFQGLRGTSIVGILFTVFLFKLRKQVGVHMMPLTIIADINQGIQPPETSVR